MPTSHQHSQSAHRHPALNWITRDERFAMLPFLLLLAASALGGGQSRSDVMSLLYVRPLAVIVIAVLVATRARLDRALRPLLWLLVALAIVTAAQLVPLPPGLWSNLPGHGPYLEAALAAGLPQPWRPISLAPDQTLNSLVSLVVPVAAVCALGVLRREDRARMLVPLLIVGCVSALLGVAQIPAAGQLALYAHADRLLPIGLFSNRNHQGLFLAGMLPLLAVWASSAEPAKRRSHALLALGATGVLVMVILLSGSRQGLALMVAGAIGAWLIMPRSRARTGVARWAPLAGGLALAALVALAVLLGRDEAVDRLTAGALYDRELRIANLPAVVQMTRAFLPFGSGMGTFDPVFRLFESDALLRPTFFNHAHNDLLEVVATGGVPALMVLAGWLWWVGRGVAALRWRRAPASAMLLGKAAAVMLAMILAASLVDYPLRTPLMMTVAALLCAWIADARAGAGDAPDVAFPPSDA